MHFIYYAASITVDIISHAGQCIKSLYVLSYTSDLKNSQSKTDHNITLVAEGTRSSQTLPDLPNGNFERVRGLGDLWKLDIKVFFGFDSCITLDDIECISIVADSTDGWNIGSIVTFAVTDNCQEQISGDYSVNEWIDIDDKFTDRLEYRLSLMTTAGLAACSCFRFLRILAYTSSIEHSQTVGDHKIELTVDGLTKTATLTKFPGQSRGNLWSRSLADDFGFPGCIRKKDIQGIALLSGNNNGWNIDSIVTYVANNDYNWELSSVDLDVNRWIDSDSEEYRKRFDLNLVI